MVFSLKSKRLSPLLVLGLILNACFSPIPHNSTQAPLENPPQIKTATTHMMLTIWPQENGQQSTSGALNINKAQHLIYQLDYQAKWILALPGYQDSWLIVDEQGESWMLSWDGRQFSHQASKLAARDPTLPPILEWTAQSQKTLNHAKWLESQSLFSNSFQNKHVTQPGLIEHRPPAKETLCNLEAGLARASKAYPHGVFGSHLEPRQLWLSNPKAATDKRT